MGKNFHFARLVLLAAFLLAGCGNRTAQHPSGSPAPAADAGERLPYAPDIDPADFVARIDNPYMPLTPGVTLVYESTTGEGLERIEVTVLDETRVVMGVAAAVVRDTVTLDGQLIEDTLDWYAQDKEGNVWYFGEAVDNYVNGELANHDGSWEAGVDGALPGIIMVADPLAHAGETYRQEYYAGEAEDMGKVVGPAGPLIVPFGEFQDVLQTEDWTPLEAGSTEFKYYAPGVGLIREVKPSTGQTSELVDMLSE